MQFLRKFRWPLVIFLAGLLIKLFGAWSKITHQVYADLALTIGFYTQMLGVLLALVLMVRLLFSRKAGDAPKT